MSSPSSTRPSRYLCLERLESRSLLAGGLMADGLAEFTGGDDRLDRSSAKQHQSIALQSGPTQSNAPPNNANRPIAGEFAAQGRLQPTLNPATESSQQQRLQSQPSVAAENTPSGFIVLGAASAPQTLATDAVLASLASVSSESTAVADEAIAGVPSSEVSTIQSADTSVRRPLGQTPDIVEIPSPEPIDFDSSEHDGTVDLTPLLAQPFQPTERASEDTWELNRETLPRLKQAIEITPGELARLADNVVTDWFGGPGGMVAVDHVQLPGERFPLDNAIVDIQLESTVMLYRSLDLFAASTGSPISIPISIPISGPVLDALMTTLEKIAESETQPVDNPAPIKVSTIAYPAIAVAATGAALSARQRSKKAEFLKNPRR